MKHWFVFGGILLVALLYAAQQFHVRSLEGERAKTTTAIAGAREAMKTSLVLQARAQAAEARAQAAEARRKAAAPARQAVVAAAPDTCGPAIAALEGERDDALDQVTHLKEALDAQKQATGVLTPAVETVAEAAEDLVDASGGSFWRDIIPDVGFGVAAGVSPLTRRADVIIGPTLHWEF